VSEEDVSEYDKTVVLDKTKEQASAGGGYKIAFYVLIAIIVTVIVTAVVMYKVIFPSEFTPVTLSEKEQIQLEQKLDRLDTSTAPPKSLPSGKRLEPEKYTEEGASREIEFSEKELNALIASNTDMAQRLAIDLSDNLASAKLLVPVDPEAPILGGKTIKVTAGMELAYAEGKPIVILKGVSLWGVPIPNAWLGNVKNVDLVQEFGSDEGFWKAFADGVELIEVKEGKLRVILKE
jgi:hypothetical protein